MQKTVKTDMQKQDTVKKDIIKNSGWGQTEFALINTSIHDPMSPPSSRGSLGWLIRHSARQTPQQQAQGKSAPLGLFHYGSCHHTSVFKYILYFPYHSECACATHWNADVLPICKREKVCSLNALCRRKDDSLIFCLCGLSQLVYALLHRIYSSQQCLK